MSPNWHILPVSFNTNQRFTVEYSDTLLGTTARLLDPHGASMVAMTVLPLSMVPTFLVPLFVMFHVICIAQAKTWKPALRRTHQTAMPVQHPAI
jgi:hypothetical protein